MKVFFEDRFYDAPEGNTPMEFCADCTLQHESCSGCPWSMVDMSKAVEIDKDSTTKEECANYVAPPKKGHFYYSRYLGKSYAKDNIFRCLVYCEGTALNELMGGMRLMDYACGMKEKLEEMKTTHRHTFYNDKLYEGCEDECLFSYIGSLLGNNFEYNTDHFDIEIPADVWEKCVDLMHDFNTKCKTIAMETATEIEPGKVETGHIYMRDCSDMTSPNVIDNLVYVRDKVEKSTSPLHKDVLYSCCIRFDDFVRRGKDANCLSQVFFSDDWKYEVTEDAVRRIAALKNEMNVAMRTLIENYIE